MRVGQVAVLRAVPSLDGPAADPVRRPRFPAAGAARGARGARPARGTGPALPVAGRRRARARPRPGAGARPALAALGAAHQPSRFLTVEVADAAVTARTPGAVVTVRSDRDGYVDAVVADPGLSPGWHDVELDLADGATVRTPVLVVSPDVQLGLVSDVDDTILETGLTRGLEFLRITLLTEVTDRAPLPGAAALYRALVCRSGEAGLPVFYLSTSPWNLHEMLLEFIALRGFPFGPLLLTDWGPGRGNLFRIGAREHKLGLIRRILAEHPGMALLLVGDTGQLDPEIYAAAAREHPGRIRAIYVRRTGALNARRAAEVDALAAVTTAAGVPMLAVDDSVEIAEHAASLGLLDTAQVDEVRRETHSDGVVAARTWPVDVVRPREPRDRGRGGWRSGVLSRLPPS